MIIKKIDIENFGKFSGKNISFKPGFNLIFGNNEDGKSTLMAFIKLMFYGNSGGKGSDISKNLRKKYLPWNGSPMSGAIEFESNGQDMRLHKDFKKTSATDKTSVSSLDNGEKLTFPPSEEMGEVFFDMEMGEFERSVFIENFGGFSSESSGDSLAMRISNLTVSGNENFSQSTVMSRISNATEELVSKSRKKGLLVDAQTKLEKLTFELDALKEQMADQYSLMSEISELQNSISSDEAKLEEIEKGQKILNAKKELNIFSTLLEKFRQREKVSSQFESYNLDLPMLRDIIVQGEKLKKEISSSLNKPIGENPAVVSDSEYSRLVEADEKISKLDNDITLIRSLISDSRRSFNEQLKKRKGTILLSSFLSIILSILAGGVCFVLFPELYYVSICAVAIGIALFFAIRHNSAKKVMNSISVRLAKQELENALRLLSFYDGSTSEKSVDELLNFASAQKDGYTELIKQKLEYYECMTLEELKERTVSAENSRFAATASVVTGLKQQFLELMNGAKPIESFEQALMLFNEIEGALSETDNIDREISTLSKTIGVESVSSDSVLAKVQELTKFVEDFPGEVSPMPENTDDIKIRLREKRSSLGELQKKVHIPEVSENYLLSQINETREEIEKFSDRHQCLSIVSDVMNEAIGEMNKGLGSYLSQKTVEYLNLMSDGEFQDVLVSRDLSVETRKALNEGFHEWKYMSAGAIDRIYLALRLAATDIIAEKDNPLPLFLDDILTQYDDENCRNALIFLKKYLETSGSVSQIFFFTCHNHIRAMAKDILTDINEIIL